MSTPDIGALVAPLMAQLPGDSWPLFLAQLERGAADRYRQWAAEVPEHGEVLQACGTREDEVADRIEVAWPPASDDVVARMAALLPGAKEIYLGLFDGLTLHQQWRLQADAEMQGSAAWRGISRGVTDPALQAALQRCAELEEESSHALRVLVATPSPTTQLFLEDAYLREFTGTVVAVSGNDVALDRTAFYATSGGQQHDTGTLGAATVVAVARRDGVVWHTLDGAVPAIGDSVAAAIDWPRRHANMRTHTAMHILCGVIWNVYGVHVTGGNMEPLGGRMDFDFDPLPPGFRETVEAAVNAEIGNDRPITVSSVTQAEAMADESLVRTKTSLLPDIATIRVVDIEGLDRQADGGTHVRSTAEVGHVQIVKVENKGKANKRVRIAVLD